MLNCPRCHPEPNDDPAFLALVDRLLAGVVARHNPQEAYVIRIDNWFDHKWLKYSGKGRVDFNSHGCRNLADVSLAPFHMKRVTFPPFNSHRVRSQVHFTRTTRGGYQQDEPARLVHRAEQRHSAHNLQLKIADFAESAVFAWFSSQSAGNGRGSVMVYTVENGNVLPWFASFHRGQEWILLHTKGIDRKEIDQLLDLQARPHASES